MSLTEKISHNVAGLHGLKTIVVWVITLALLVLAVSVIARLSLQLLHAHISV